jgi:cation diffusion facilitator CzcD-associated flavoprotein CzcO
MNIHPLTDTADDTRIAADWLARFDAALGAGDAGGVAALFAPDGYWRDLLAHQWDYRALRGPDLIAATLIAEGRARGVQGFALHPAYSAPSRRTRAGRRVIEGFTTFRTGLGEGSGLLRLHEGADGVWRAWGFMTSLQSLDDYPEAIGMHRPERIRTRAEGENWSDRVAQDSDFSASDPEVLVVGGGHSGLMIAARLKAMGVRVLIIEALPRVGDVWRNRYHTLQLHNEIDTIDFPYITYPQTWPRYLPKDMYAAFMEFYALAMELPVWTAARFDGGNHDPDRGVWTARVRMGDGTLREVHPRHIVLATGGVSGRRKMPNLPGLDTFAGVVAHSSDVRPDDAFRGKRAIVVGTSTSGHDIALELTQRGCEVTMVQRGPTVVVNIDPANLIYAIYKEGRSIDEIDVVAIANDYQASMESYREFARIVTEMDRDTHDGLRRVGFQLDQGYLGGGYFANYLHRGGGYYLNVGASEYIIDGRIGLIQNDRIVTYEPGGARLDDGSLLPADIVVLATGYQNQEVDIREYFGDAVAGRVGPVWGWDEGGELRRTMRPTGQPGLWLQLGGVPQARTYSKFLALQIVAELRGLK